jgi:hypothetical protein
VAGVFAQVKIDMRRAVHTSLAVAVVYTAPDGTVTQATTDDDGNVLPGFTCRYHNKVNVSLGNLENTGYPTTLEGVDKLVFSTDEIAALGVTPVRNGTVFFPDYGMTFSLDNQAPSDGPINVYWNVTREDGN